MRPTNIGKTDEKKPQIWLLFVKRRIINHSSRYIHHLSGKSVVVTFFLDWICRWNRKAENWKRGISWFITSIPWERFWKDEARKTRKTSPRGLFSVFQGIHSNILSKESALQMMSSTDTPLNTVEMLRRKQQQTKSPFINLTGGSMLSAESKK